MCIRPISDTMKGHYARVSGEFWEMNFGGTLLVNFQRTFLGFNNTLILSGDIGEV